VFFWLAVVVCEVWRCGRLHGGRCFRNVAGVPLEPATEDALNSIAAEMKIGRSDILQIVLREWLETNAYLPVRVIDEESDTDGRA
jgi:hypothetical protein